MNLALLSVMLVLAFVADHIADLGREFVANIDKFAAVGWRASLTQGRALSKPPSFRPADWRPPFLEAFRKTPRWQDGQGVRKAQLRICGKRAAGKKVATLVSSDALRQLGRSYLSTFRQSRNPTPRRYRAPRPQSHLPSCSRAKATQQWRFTRNRERNVAAALEQLLVLPPNRRSRWVEQQFDPASASAPELFGVAVSMKRAVHASARNQPPPVIRIDQAEIPDFASLINVWHAGTAI